MKGVGWGGRSIQSELGQGNGSKKKKKKIVLDYSVIIISIWGSTSLLLILQGGFVMGGLLVFWMYLKHRLIIIGSVFK